MPRRLMLLCGLVLALCALAPTPAQADDRSAYDLYTEALAATDRAFRGSSETFRRCERSRFKQCEAILAQLSHALGVVRTFERDMKKETPTTTLGKRGIKYALEDAVLGKRFIGDFREGIRRLARGVAGGDAALDRADRIAAQSARKQRIALRYFRRALRTQPAPD